MHKFILMGNGPLTNRGCEAITLGTKKILEREFGEVDFLLASFADDSKSTLPDNIHPLAFNYPIERPRWSKAWWQYQLGRLAGRSENKAGFLGPLKDKLKGIDAAFSIGGDGYAIDYGHNIVDRLVIANNHMKSLGIPVIIWGASIGPFSKESDFERQMAQHFSKLDLIVVREPASFNYLKSLGVVQNVQFAPDPAFALEAEACQLPDDINEFLEKLCLGINLSPVLAKYLTGGNMAMWRKLASDILRQLIIDIGLPLILVPHVTGQQNQILMDDEIFLRTVTGMMHTSEQKLIRILPRNLNSENLKWVISKCSAFVGARTHSTIAALSSCVPCLSIAYSRKAWGINELIFGHTKWVLSSTEMNPKVFSDQVETFLQNKEGIQGHLKSVIPDMISESYKIAGKVRNVIKNK